MEVHRCLQSLKNRPHIPFGYVGCLLSFSMRRLKGRYNQPDNVKLVLEVLDDVRDMSSGAKVTSSGLYTQEPATRALQLVVEKLKDLRRFATECTVAAEEEFGPPMTADNLATILERFAIQPDVDSAKLEIKEVGRYILSHTTSTVLEIGEKLDQFVRVLETHYL